jgi:hypothetical protein
MSMFETLDRNRGQNQAEFDLLESQLAKLLEEAVEVDPRPDGILELRHVATLKPGDVESRCASAQQCARVLWWLSRPSWLAEDACSLVFGIDPPVVADDDAPPVEIKALDGRVLTVYSSELHDAWDLFQSLLVWMDYQVEHAVATPETLACQISPADFINWCEDESIDTNYLRLMRTLIGAGNDTLVGRLPLADVRIFKPGKQ